MAATAAPPNVFDAMKQVAEDYAKTVQAGMKFYEDTAQIYAEMATKNVDQATAGYAKLATDLADLNKKNFERVETPAFPSDYLSLLCYIRSLPLAPGDTLAGVPMDVGAASPFGQYLKERVANP